MPGPAPPELIHPVRGEVRYGNNRLKAYVRFSEGTCEDVVCLEIDGNQIYLTKENWYKFVELVGKLFQEKTA